MLKRVLDQSQRPSALLAGQWAWLFLLLLTVVFSITGRGFFSLFNLQNIVTDMAFVLLMAIGQTYVIISGGIDLSIGYIMGLSAVVSARVLLWTSQFLPLPLAILVAVIVGLLVGIIPGLINGTIIARLNMPPFIVTLGMYGILRGVSFILANGQQVSLPITGLGALGNNYFLYLSDKGLSFFQPPTGLTAIQMQQMIQIIPFQLVISLLIVWIAARVLARSRFGMHIYAIGGNREAAARSGIPVAHRTLQIYMFSAFMAAIAGLLYMLRYTSGTADAGDALLIDSIAVVTIGGASLFGGEGSIMGTLVGALIIAVIQNGLIIIGIDPFWQFIAVGCVIILAVLIDRAKARIKGA